MCALAHKLVPGSWEWEVGVYSYDPAGYRVGGPPTILEVVFRTCDSRRKVAQWHETNYCAIFLGSGGQKLTVLEHFLSVTFYPPWDYIPRIWLIFAYLRSFRPKYGHFDHGFGRFGPIFTLEMIHRQYAIIVQPYHSLAQNCPFPCKSHKIGLERHKYHISVNITSPGADKNITIRSPIDLTIFSAETTPDLDK